MKKSEQKPAVLCACGCKLPLKADGTVDYVLDFKEVVCQCKPGCGTRFHVPAHQARIGAGNIWFAAGHVSTTSPVAVVVECKRE